MVAWQSGSNSSLAQTFNQRLFLLSDFCISHYHWPILPVMQASRTYCGFMFDLVSKCVTGIHEFSSDHLTNWLYQLRFVRMFILLLDTIRMYANVCWFDLVCEMFWRLSLSDLRPWPREAISAHKPCLEKLRNAWREVRTGNLKNRVEKASEKEPCGSTPARYIKIPHTINYHQLTTSLCSFPFKHRWIVVGKLESHFNFTGCVLKRCRHLSKWKRRRSRLM